MGWIQSAAAVALICLAAGGAFGQTEPPPEGDSGAIVPPGPIVNGKHIQPTQTDIQEREAVRQPGQPETAPPRNDNSGDKELDQLYEDVLKESQHR
jgi:hypothetical protein